MVFVNLFVRKQTGRGGQLSNDSFSWAYFKRGMGLTEEL